MLFLHTLEEVNVGALGSDMVIRFVGLQIARDISSLMPPAFFISVLVALGRMSRDSELIALRACGLGNGRKREPLLLTVRFPPRVVLNIVVIVQYPIEEEKGSVGSSSLHVKHYRTANG